MSDELYDFVGMGSKSSFIETSISSIPASIELTAEDRIKHLVANLAAQSSAQTSNSNRTTNDRTTSDSNARIRQNKSNHMRNIGSNTEDVKYTRDGYNQQYQSNSSLSSISPSLHDLANMHSLTIDSNSGNTNSNLYNQQHRSSNRTTNTNQNPVDRRQHHPLVSHPSSSIYNQQQQYHDNDVLSDPLAAFEVLQQSGSNT